jgi:hypothetical protein
MFSQRFRAQVHTPDGKLLHTGHGSTAPEAFTDAWLFMKRRLASPLPPSMEVRIVNDNYYDAPMPHEYEELASYRHSYIVCRTQSVVKREQQDCEECGFPDVTVETGTIQAVDTLGFLHMDNILKALVAPGPSVISSAPFRRQMECECCTMLVAKGVRSPPKAVRA